MSSVDILGSIVNLSVWSETDNLIEVTLTDASTGTAVNLSNETVTFIARDKREGTLKIGPLVNAPGGHSDPTAGKTRFKLTRTALALSTPTKPETWAYEVRRTVPVSLDQIVYISGNLVVRPNVGV